MRELQVLELDTGIFGKISDEAIKQAEGQTYTKSKMMSDPLAGLTGTLEEDDQTWQE